MRSAALADDKTGAQIGNQLFRQVGIGNRFLHGDPGIGMALGHEAQDLAIDQRFDVEVTHGTGDLRAQALLRIFGLKGNARTAFTQAIQDFGLVVAQAGDDTQTSYYYTTHYRVLPNARKMSSILTITLRSYLCG